jgi:hypothetical protein
MFGSWRREILNFSNRGHRKCLTAVLMGCLDNLCSTSFPWKSEASHCILKHKELIRRDWGRKGVRMGANSDFRNYRSPRVDLSPGVNSQAEDRVGPVLRESVILGRVPILRVAR